VKSLPSKRRILKKKREKEQGLKRKRGKTPFEKHHVSKKKEKRGCDPQAVGRDSIEKERKEITFFLQCKIRCVASSIPTHHLHLDHLLFLDLSLSYPHSLHHSPSTIIICHTNSLEFSFAFTIYRV
jgi:hypothetical protein